MDEKHDPREDYLRYGFMERELAENAAAQLHIRLANADIEDLSKVVEWEAIAANAPDIRERLHLEMVTNSW